MKALLTPIVLAVRAACRLQWCASGFYKLISVLPLRKDSRAQLASAILADSTLYELRQHDLKREKLAKRNQIDRKRSLVSSARLRLVLTVIGSLARLERYGFRGLNVILYRALKLAGVSEWRVNRVRQTISDKAELLAASGINPVIWLAALQSSERNSQKVSTEQLAKYRTIHVFIEPGAAIPALLVSEAMSALNYIWYSFSDVSQSVADLGISSRSEYAQLRDRYNDISPEGVALFEASHALAQRLSTDILDVCLPNQQDIQHNLFGNVLTTGFFDKITHRVTLAKCYEQAMKGVPGEDAVLFVAASDRYLVNGWQLFSGVLDIARTFVVYGRANKREAIDFGRNLRRAIVEEQATSRRHLMCDVDHLKQDAARTTVSEKFYRAFSEIKQDSIRFSKKIKAWSDDNLITVLAHAGDTEAYNTTLEEVGAALIQDDQQSDQGHIPLFLHCAAGPEVRVTPKLLSQDSSASAAAVSLEWFTVTIEGLQTDLAHRQNIEVVLQDLMSRYTDQMPIFNVRLLLSDIARVLESQIYWIYAAYSLSKAMVGAVSINSVLSSPSRQILVRAFCAGLLDAPEFDRQLIDLQSMNILPHPKYLPPLATEMAVIDEIAVDIYEHHFGIDRSKIHVVGNAANDVLRRKFETCDSVQARKDLSIPEQASVILLISQLQPMEWMADIARPLAEMAAEDPLAHLIVKLHPRETSEREQAYIQILRQYLPVERFTISKYELPLSVIAVSDVCVTIYSNMAREAAVLGKPVIVVDYLDWDRPIRFEEAGLATAAGSKDELHGLIKEFNGKGHDKEFSVAAARYLENNAHLTTGCAAKRILALISPLGASD